MASIHTNRGAKRARGARETLGIPLDEPLPDLLGVVEDRAGVHVVVLDLADGVAGAYLPRPDCPLAFVNGTEALVRQRFTLAHELGHHWIGHGATVDEVATIFGSGRDPREIEANAFAAEFLLPRAAVKRLFDGRRSLPVGLDSVVRIAVAFGLSAQMVRIKLETCGVLDDPERIARLDAEIAGDQHLELRRRLDLEPLDDGLSRAGRRRPRVPEPLRGSALGLYLTGEIDLDALAARTGRRNSEVARMLGNLGLTATAAAPSG
ncbi:ImmA/IrrE family metallo-endopeptidase [Capillimicrobium parvum]|uniref:IrrE N-terminal-like domain-containing protein n=1 Tax=Capillimicrobium parvum TaxID=2884022 RepID=A0A9E6Y1P8_9ACTN|nr:ImmA/IrrE family metallo-endopeptidase [Capillimicrobium parvum]UGS38499.1 hypothetical protein DSM104329_04928 [Capillimicrobium parvum]